MESGRDHDSDAFEESVHDDFDDFDDYSDSFESSDGNEGDGTQHHTETSIELRSGSARPVHDAKNSHQWELGDRVQVHWQDANEWFAGRVVQVDPLRDRYFVHYDDDDEAWEVVHGICQTHVCSSYIHTIMITRISARGEKLTLYPDALAV